MRGIEEQMSPDSKRSLHILINERLLGLHELLRGRRAGHPPEQIPINRRWCGLISAVTGAFDRTSIREVQRPRAAPHQGEMNLHVLALTPAAVDALRASEVPLEHRGSDAAPSGVARSLGVVRTRETAAEPRCHGCVPSVTETSTL